MTIREYEHSFDLFGTRVRLLIGTDPATPFQATLGALRVQARLQGLHRALTRFDPDSELCQLNARAGTRVPVSPTMVRALHAALAAAEISDGLVDPTILPDLERAGYAASRVGAVPARLETALAAAPPRQPAQRSRSGDWRGIELNPHRQSVRIPGGVRLDLGGTAKGMGVDVAAEVLAKYPRFAVDAGGDVRLGGTQRVARTVRITHPLHDSTAHELVVTAGAVATSGLRTRVWRTSDGFAHHLIDPACGAPAWTGVIQATALAPSALEAETLAKTALLRGPDAGSEVLARHGGVLIRDDGQVVLIGERPPAPHTDHALTS